MRQFSQDTLKIGDIRTAMQQVAVEVPKLSLPFEEDPTLVQQRLLAELGATATPTVLQLINCANQMYDSSGQPHVPITEEDRTSARLLAKMERYTLVQAGGNVQARSLLRGRGRDARFNPIMIEEILGQSASSGISDNFDTDAGALMLASVERLQQGSSWFNLASKRYAKLFTPQNLLATYPDGTPTAVRSDLATALNGAALIRAIFELESFTGSIPEEEFMLEQPSPILADERITAAHDLAYLPLKQASLNFDLVGTAEDLSSLDPDRLIKLNGHWLWKRNSPNDSAKDRQTIDEESGYSAVFPKRDAETLTLKCPIHQPSKAQPDSHVARYLHAAITLGYERYGMFQ